MTEETKLLPCPFCGAQPEITPWHRYSDVVVIHCTNEECEVGAETSAVGRELAVTAWNKRGTNPVLDGWRPVRFDHLAAIMSLLPPPPLTQDGLTHRFEGPNPHDTIYAIRKVFAEMLGARPEQPFPSLSLQDGAVAAERERCARIVDAEVIFARENLDTIPDEAEGDLGSRLTPRYYWGQRLALAKHYASEIRSPAVATILAEDGTK